MKGTIKDVRVLECAVQYLNTMKVTKKDQEKKEKSIAAINNVCEHLKGNIKMRNLCEWF